MALAVPEVRRIGAVSRRRPKALGCLALITARGGSKGLPRKNVRLLAGKPLIAWTIEAARRSRSLARVIVSTEDAEIAAVARRCGAEVPFRRPAALAQDDTPGIDPVLHALEWLRAHGDSQPGWVMVLQPTSPLRSGEDIDAAMALAIEREADAVVSVTPVQHHPYWMKELAADGRLESCVAPEQATLRRQDLPPRFVVNGAVYLGRGDVVTARRTFYTERTFGYVMPPERSLDIDSEWEFHLAELVLKERLRHGRR